MTTAMHGQVITCEDCGWPYATVAKNTKVCYLCRMGRNLDFLNNRKQTCVVCEHRFMPYERTNKQLGKCGDCSLSPKPLDVEGDCVWCNRHTKFLMHKDLLICRSCMTNEAKRPGLIKALTKKIQRRIASTPTEEDFNIEERYLSARRAKERPGSVYMEEVLAGATGPEPGI